MATRTVQAVARTLMALTLVAGLAVTVPHTQAQQIAVTTGGGFGGGMDGGLVAPIGKSDVEVMSKMFSLSADQKTAAGVLLDSYLAEHAKRADVIRAAQESARAAFREDRDFSAFADLAPKMEAFAKENASQETQLLENIKSVLDKDQLQQWPAWERAHRRAGSMNRGMLAGERADLIQIVERLRLPEPTTETLAPTLEAYSMELDRAIIARDEVQKAATEEGKGMRDLFGKGGGDMTEMMKKVDELMKRGREASLPVRDINRRYAKQIEATLAGINAADGARFGLEFRKASFPDVYRERYTDRALAAAAAMDDLDKGQREGIAALKEQYRRDCTPMEQAAEKAADDAEANFSLSGMMGGGGVMRMMGGDEATQAARKARRELDTATLDRLKAILTPEQGAKLPDRSQDTGNEGGFGGFGGGGGGMRIMAPR